MTKAFPVFFEHDFCLSPYPGVNDAVEDFLRLAGVSALAVQQGSDAAAQAVVEGRRTIVLIRDDQATAHDLSRSWRRRRSSSIHLVLADDEHPLGAWG